MKHGRFIISLLWGLFVFCQSAQSVNEEQTQEGRIKTLWVVDGVALNDSVFDYSLEQMQSELPYYRTEHLIGRYTGKQGRLSYELKLNSDSSYVFSKTDTHKKAITPEIRNYGEWNISSGEIELISSQDPIILLQGCTVSLDTVRLEMKTDRALTLPKDTWYNKKSVTLKRQYDETDR